VQFGLIIFFLKLISFINQLGKEIQKLNLWSKLITNNINKNSKNR